MITSWGETVDYIKDNVKYIIYKREICPDTKKLHYHIYVEFIKRVVMKSIKKIFGDDTIHIEKRMGSVKQCQDYIKKDKDDGFVVFEDGDVSKQGERNDIKDAVNSIIEGATTLDIIEENPVVFCKYHKALEKIKFEVMKENANKWRNIKTTVLIGPAGCGKTRTVIDKYGSENVFKLNSSDKGTVWFNGYEGEKVLLIDDFYGWIKYGDFLTMLDGYKYRCDIKGGHTWAFWDTIYITSNDAVSSWYAKGLTPALKRRINKIIELTVKDKIEN